MDAAVISEKGTRRSMEDAHFLDLNFGGKGWVYGGIYDGHNGGFAARYAAERLHKIFLEKLLLGLNPPDSFIESYETVSEEISGQESGTTAVDFFIKDNTVFVANVGDARAIIVNQNEAVQLTIDHRVDNAVERQRIEKLGALIEYPYVVKGDLGLMPTRTIGDQYFKTVGVIATPSLNEYLISHDDLMLVSACDGLWDFLNIEEVATLARKYSEPSSLTDVLTREVLVNRLGSDNLTMIVIMFPRR